MKAVDYCTYFPENFERVIALLSGEKPTEEENYLIRLESKNLSSDIRDTMKTLCEFG